jgi:hypothetical protein
MQNLIASFWHGGIQPLVLKALKLKPRGGIANDVLVLNRVSGQLQLEWRARDVHPWDRDAHDSTNVILGGMVTREDALATDTSGSLRLRLRMLGIQYSRIVDGQLEPLSTHSRPVLAVA